MSQWSSDEMADCGVRRQVQISPWVVVSAIYSLGHELCNITVGPRSQVDSAFHPL